MVEIIIPDKMNNEESKIYAGLVVQARKMNIATAKMVGLLNRLDKYNDTKVD